MIHILNKENRDVVAYNVPVPFGGVHFNGKAPHIAGGIGRATRPRYGREPHKDGGLHGGVGQDFGRRQFFEGFVQLEMAVGRCATGMNNALRDPFVVEVLQFFAQDVVFQQGRAAFARPERVLIGGNWLAHVGRQGLTVFRFQRMLRRNAHRGLWRGLMARWVGRILRWLLSRFHNKK
jgi:hypothetical protein